jgi:signal transduction histidine kinase
MSAVPGTELPSLQQAALRRVAGLAASGAAPSEVFAAVAYEVAQVTGSALVQIQRFEPDDTVTVAGAWGAAPHPFQPGTRWGLEGSQIAAPIKRTGRPVRVDAFREGSGPITAGVRRTGIRGGAGAPIVVDGKLWGVMAAGPAEGEPVPVGLEERLVEFTDLVATAISNAESREALKRLADEQAALRRVATLVANGVPPAEVFEAVAREAGRLLDVDAMHMGRYDAGAAISVAGWSREGGHLPVGTRVELDGTNVASLVLKSGRPARIDGYSGGTGMADRLRRHMGVYSSVAVPIVVDGRLWGLMIASSRRDQALPADTESRLLGFTELAETAISNTQARAELAASRARLVAAADEERRRVVGDLHGGAERRLGDTIATLERAERELGDDEVRARELVKAALSHAERTTAELRELAYGILPGVLTSGGLRAAADALASRMTIPVAVDVVDKRHPSPIEATAYFVIAEALTNVAKHSGAQRATVTVRVEDGALRVQVRDDGAGGARTGGSGLVGLHDRLAAHEGTLTVDSPPGAGTVVTATIPLSAVA